MTDHGVHGRIRVVRGDLDARVLPGKDAEYFVGESLPDRLHVAEIDHDLAELLEIGNEPLAAAGQVGEESPLGVHRDTPADRQLNGDAPGLPSTDCQS